jgi:hypothetical protein
MADFLTRLLERSMGMASVVQPAIKPLFSMGPALTKGAEREFESLATEEAVAPREAPIPGETLPGHAPVRPALLAPRYDASGRPTPRLLNPPGRTEESIITRSTRAFSRNGDSGQAKPGPYGPKAEPDGKLDESAPPGMLEDGERLRSEARPDEAPVLARRETEPAGTQFRPLKPTGVATLMAVEPRSAKLLPRVESEANSEPEPPAIRVTIGRVEVRAAMPSAQPAARNTPARRNPVLSLDEYLKQLNTGKR